MKVTRAEVEQAHGKQLSDFVWESLAREAEENYELVGLDFTLDAALGLLRVERRERHARTTEALELRGEALGAWALQSISARTSVQHWRLRYGTLSPDALHATISEAIAGAEGTEAHSIPLEWLELDDGAEVAHIEYVPRRSWLAELADLSAEVADEYRMLRPDACVAIACDVAGMVEPVVVSGERRATFAGFWSGGVGPATRIVLHVDPMTSPEVVADVYRRARADWFPGRRRIMGERQLRLASFMAGEERVSGLRSWRFARSFVDIELDWRAKTGEPASPNFARDARRAVRMLLGG